MERRQFLGATAATVAALTINGEAIAQNRRKPNFIIILCDDLGWGDIEPNGGKTVATPNINRLAASSSLMPSWCWKKRAESGPCAVCETPDRRPVSRPLPTQIT
jgi:hypothetical protein